MLEACCNILAPGLTQLPINRGQLAVVELRYPQQAGSTTVPISSEDTNYGQAEQRAGWDGGERNADAVGWVTWQADRHAFAQAP
jgi:hypothetical protein